MTDSELINEEIYHALQHIKKDLVDEEIESAKYTVDWCINKIQSLWQQGREHGDSGV